MLIGGVTGIQTKVSRLQIQCTQRIYYSNFLKPKCSEILEWVEWSILRDHRIKLPSPKVIPVKHIHYS